MEPQVNLLKHESRGLAYLVGLFLTIPVVGDAIAFFFLVIPLAAAIIAVSKHKAADLLILLGFTLMFSFGVGILFFALRDHVQTLGPVVPLSLLAIRFAIVTEGYLWLHRRMSSDAAARAACA